MTGRKTLPAKILQKTENLEKYSLIHNKITF